MKHNSNHDQQAVKGNTINNWLKLIWKFAWLLLKVLMCIDKLNQFFDGGEN